MEAVVITMPEPLERIAQRIRAGQSRAENGRAEWIEGTLEIATAMAEGCERFPSTQGFCVWLSDNGFTFHKDLRSALINMGMNTELTREVLGVTKRSSWECIWREEIRGRVRSVPNSTSNQTESPTSKPAPQRHGAKRGRKADAEKKQAKPPPRNPNWDKYKGNNLGVRKEDQGPTDIYGMVQTAPTYVVDARRRSHVAAELVKALRLAEESVKAANKILDDGFDVSALAATIIVRIESPDDFAKDLRPEWREHFNRRFDTLAALIERLRPYRAALT